MIRSAFILIFLPLAAFGQFTYSIDQSIPVEANGRNLSMPWAGGLNSAQVNTIDIDGDGKQDVVIFDRAADKIMPYRNVDGKYEYAPDYAALFPESVSQWMLLRDFNCDGKKDIFTNDPFGIAVFVNTTKAGQPLSWRTYHTGFPLLTVGFDTTATINLKINASDIPAIDDVDNDGDLDILNMRFVGVGTIEWHKNLSMERTGRCDSLQLRRVTQNYGGVEECTCGIFAFGQTCDALNGGRTQHVGGKTLITIDIDNDGDRELLYSEESCSALYMMRNNGTKDNPVFNSAVPYPTQSPAAFLLFPGAYIEDVDFDGLTDLIASPNLYARQFTNTIVRNSLWLYKNTGTPSQPAFTFVKNNFLQEDMIDVGDFSTPAVFDSDNDGDEDLFIGFYGDASFQASVYHFENVGTKTEPSFKFVTDNFANLRSWFSYNMKPQFADMNGDGKVDFVFTSTSLQDGVTELDYVANLADEGLQLAFTVTQTQFKVGQSENIRIVDVNKDGIPDVLVGRATGALQYWENGSNSGFFEQLTMKSSSYLGLGNSTSRQNPAVAVADLDGDGLEDLVLADQRGNVSFYGDFRKFDPILSQPATDAIFNSILKEYRQQNLGGRLWPTIANLFNSDKPAVLLGNTLGGIYVLRNDEGAELPEQPVLAIGPNPLSRESGLPLQIKSDRNTQVQIFSLIGQKMSEKIFIQANQAYPLALNNMAAGMYVARFTFPGRSESIKFILK